MKDENFLNCTCPVCGKKFHRKPSQLKKNKRAFCSQKCHYVEKSEYMKGEGNHQYGLRGKANPTFKTGEKITIYGYKSVLVPDHPFTAKDRRMFEHRLVAEKYLLTEENSVEIDGKRYLSPEYVVHHKNHIRTDNRPENLEVMKRGEHTSFHCKEKPMPRDPVTQRFTRRKAV